VGDHETPQAAQDIGERWAAQGRTAVLAVPSAVIPQEQDFLLNPSHPQFLQIQVHRAEAVPF
jgi:RES domain-containing protein